MVFRLSSPFPTQCRAAVTTVGSENPRTFFTVPSTHGLSSSTSRFGSDILWEHNVKRHWNTDSYRIKPNVLVGQTIYQQIQRHMKQKPNSTHAQKGQEEFD